METRAYLFIDEAGAVADREAMTPTEAQLRNAYAAPGQALRWKTPEECIAEVLDGCVMRLALLKAHPVRSTRA